MDSESFRDRVEYSMQLDWLAWSLQQAQIRRLPNRALLDVVRKGIPSRNRERILKEVERRLDFWSGNEYRSLAAALDRLHRKNPEPGSAAQAVDRLLRRLLWQLTGKRAEELALSCAVSPRQQRRMAAWRYFGHHEINEAARDLLAEQAEKESHIYFFRLVASDARLLSRIGLAAVLAALDEFYWRGRALQTYLAGGDSPGSVAYSYPGETIFAIRRAERLDLIPLATRLLNDNRNDPWVVSAAVQCFGALEASKELAEAVDAGRELLKNVPEDLRELRSFDRILEEVARDPLEL